MNKDNTPGSNGNNPSRTRAKHRINARTISEIARFCAKQLSESEACRLLNIRPQSWFSWKSRHNRAEKFAALLEEFRAGRINDLIERIEKSADGIGMKQPDWRAAAFLLSVADSKRFAASGNVSVETHTPPIIVDMSELMAIAEKVWKAQQSKQVEVQTPKQLPATTSDEQTAP